MRYDKFLVAITTATLLCCAPAHSAPPPAPAVQTANTRDDDAPQTISAIDKAVMAAALENFSQWKSATFGMQEGVFEVKPDSLIIHHQEINSIKAFADITKNHLSDDIVDSFMKRNNYATPIAALIAESPSVRLQQAPHTSPADRLPDGVRAIGSLTLPGFSADGARAFVEIYHSWSIHFATTMFVLSLDQGNWKVIARDQIVFL